ncbi:MAG: hypothetical protein KAQ96_08290, partial [Thermoplasmata archaeon]|nr:hypothetical protein [Thermoplasmata archaeon]
MLEPPLLVRCGISYKGIAWQGLALVDVDPQTIVQNAYQCSPSVPEWVYMQEPERRVIRRL